MQLKFYFFLQSLVGSHAKRMLRWKQLCITFRIHNYQCSKSNRIYKKSVARSRCTDDFNDIYFSVTDERLKKYFAVQLKSGLRYR